MFAIQIATMLLTLVGIILPFLLHKKKTGGVVGTKLYKFIASILALVFFFRYMMGNEPVRYIFALEGDTVVINGFWSVVSIILIWFQIAAELGLILYPFFKTPKYTVVIKYFCLPVMILCMLGFYPLTLGAVFDPYIGFNVRTLLLGLEIGVAIGMAFMVFADEGWFKCNKSDLRGLWYIVGMLLATMPSYILEAVFGLANYVVKIKSFKQPHRIILYLMFLIPIAIYLLLKKKDSKVIKLCLLYISLGTLITFSIHNKFETFTNPLGWPLHLCNTAMYIIPLCLIFNWKKLFYFTYFINVLGAFLAMVMPNYDDALNIFSERIVAFYVNHYIAFFLPILMVALNVYKRPKLKEFKYSMIGFGIYFVIALVCNVWFSNYGTVDYFYINSDFVAEKLGLERLLDVTWSFNINDLTFMFYPLYQAIFFVCYVFLGAGVWFIYEAMYSTIDTVHDIVEKKKKIKADILALQVAMDGRGLEEPMNKDGVNKIILKDFSKRYSTSSVYAVKSANLEICGGEIFGFLGHNGAGKSTIIKSIVGILPVTEGSIEVCGYDVEKQATMAKKNIGYVPDHYALYERLSGREYINYIADLYGVSKEDRTAAINKYVDLFELRDAFDNQIKTYSHGMKQKITIISALVHNPKVWILDEPLTGLDPTSIFQVKECMREHAKQGNIVFFSSHLIDIVESLCDRIAVIKKGNILVCEDVKNIEKDSSLEDYYLEITSRDVRAVKYKDKDVQKEESGMEELARLKAEKKQKKEEKAKLKAEKKLLKEQKKKGQQIENI
ncbi:MAG: ATP-binding cassette domain-containing protein [Clostridiales bacterium]|nr:ATP-binding cassette domain-containing protein [Clostridiales bacterium]